jgi:16S rRNA (guanine527-N7)-methyltransferase
MSFAPEGELASKLEEGLRRLEVPLEPSQQAALLRHLALIEQWNRVYNLTAVREPAQMLTQHVFDSLAVVAPLKRRLVECQWSDRVPLLDVGSGAGLPGVAIAVACPEITVTCVDAVGKKAGFVRQVGAELALPDFAAVHGRVEALKPLPWRVIASRAFASLDDFATSTASLLAPDGIWMAMKGKLPTDEIEQLSRAFEVFHVEPLDVPGLNAERCIVWMRKRAAPS